MKAEDLKLKLKINDVDSITKLDLKYYLLKPISFINDYRNKTFKMKYFIRLDNIEYEMDSVKEQNNFYKWAMENCFEEKLFNYQSNTF